MTTYVIRRLLLIIPTVFVALSLLFVLFFLLPGDPAKLLAGGSNRTVDPGVIERVEERYGLNESKPQQFVEYWKRTIQWDLGESFRTRRSVNEILGDRAVNSIRLGIWAIIIETTVGIGVGLISALRRYSVWDKLTTIVTAAASAIPVFVLGFILQYGFAVTPNKNGWPDWMRLRTQGLGPDSWTCLLYTSDAADE